MRSSLVLLSSLSLLACSWGRGESATGGGATGPSLSTLVIANAVKVDTLDPAQNSVNESIWLDQNLYSRLLQPNSTGTGSKACAGVRI